MLHINKVPGRPLRGHFSVAWRGGGLSPPPCSRLPCLILCDWNPPVPSLKSVRDSLRIVDSPHLDTIVHVRNWGNNLDISTLKDVSHFCLPSRATLACDVFIIAWQAKVCQAITINRYHTVIKRSVRSIERMYKVPGLRIVHDYKSLNFTKI